MAFNLHKVIVDADGYRGQYNTDTARKDGVEFAYFKFIFRWRKAIAYGKISSFLSLDIAAFVLIGKILHE